MLDEINSLANVRSLRCWDSLHRLSATSAVKTNAGSACMRHVVLIWTIRGHTYGIGFHNVHGLGATLDLDADLARGVRFIAPEESK